MHHCSLSCPTSCRLCYSVTAQMLLLLLLVLVLLLLLLTALLLLPLCKTLHAYEAMPTPAAALRLEKTELHSPLQPSLD
jgi:hypothetical protein